MDNSVVNELGFHVREMLRLIGEDTMREGLQETPMRAARAWLEWTAGYGQDPAEHLKIFEAAGSDEMVISHNIPIVSKCEHHLADIIGVAHIGYIPEGRIIGLSKLARIANVFAHRLQVQERLTTEIADALFYSELRPKGVGVLIRAAHHCMSTRGVRIHGTTTTTSALRGVLRESESARTEFITLCGMAQS